jgi:hypothetical protein
MALMDSTTSDITEWLIKNRDYLRAKCWWIRLQLDMNLQRYPEEFHYEIWMQAFKHLHHEILVELQKNLAVDPCDAIVFLAGTDFHLVFDHILGDNNA